eukprot:1193868-Prorocentrum_minimum.AAC.3
MASMTSFSASLPGRRLLDLLNEQQRRLWLVLIYLKHAQVTVCVRQLKHLALHRRRECRPRRRRGAAHIARGGHHCGGGGGHHPPAVLQRLHHLIAVRCRTGGDRGGRGHRVILLHPSKRLS